MVATGNNLKYNYTVIELLVVIVIVGILLAVSMGGLSMMNKRQGAAGAVRTISSKISLARSYAVVTNRYVALLIPTNNKQNPTELSLVDFFNDPEDHLINYTRYNYTSDGGDDNFKNYYYTQTRLCFVEFNGTNYIWKEWIDGNSWDSLPNGTCAYILSCPKQIINIDSNNSKNSAAVIFKPTGIPLGDEEIKIRAFMGIYIVDKDVVKLPKTASDRYNANKTVRTYSKLISWVITINAFTGRSDYVKNN